LRGSALRYALCHRVGRQLKHGDDSLVARSFRRGPATSFRVAVCPMHQKQCDDRHVTPPRSVVQRRVSPVVANVNPRAVWLEKKERLCASFVPVHAAEVERGVTVGVGGVAISTLLEQNQSAVYLICLARKVERGRLVLVFCVDVCSQLDQRRQNLRTQMGQ
jgi:hypothetical protein